MLHLNLPGLYLPSTTHPPYPNLHTSNTPYLTAHTLTPHTSTYPFYIPYLPKSHTLTPSNPTPYPIADNTSLKLQLNKCFGCGEPIFASFLTKNFQPCRVLGGLFCTKWCHFSQHQTIPSRVRGSWDLTPHRVSVAAGDYLKFSHFLPFVAIPVQGVVLEGVPQMASLYRIRREIFSKIDGLLNDRGRGGMGMGEGGVEGVEGEIVRILTLFGKPLYLCFTLTLYSMDDIKEVVAGRLLDRLNGVYRGLVELEKGVGR